MLPSSVLAVGFFYFFISSSLVFFCGIKGQLKPALVDFCWRNLMGLKWQGTMDEQDSRIEVRNFERNSSDFNPTISPHSDCGLTQVIFPAFFLMTSWNFKEGKNSLISSRELLSNCPVEKLHFFPRLFFFSELTSSSFGPKQRRCHGDLILLLSTSPGLHHHEDRGCDLMKTLQCKHSSPVPTSGQEKVQSFKRFLDSIKLVRLPFTQWGKKDPQFSSG